MRRCVPLSLLVLTLLVPRPAQAQSTMGYFVELGGNGGFASINLDLPLTQRLHARAGGGLLLWPTAPLTVSYLIGSGPNRLEIGGGATVIFFPPENPDSPALERIVSLFTIGQGLGTRALMTGVLGYRHEGPTGSTVRVTFTPYFGKGRMVAWLGVSLGGRF
jgi:hypothetical protein